VAKLSELSFRNFSGGLNTRDSASELGEHEFPFSSNVTLDERGGIQKRLGYEARYAAHGSGLTSNGFDWETKGYLVTQVGATMHVNGGAAFHTWTTSDRCGMTEFLGNLVMIHPVDGTRVYDGTTVTTPTNPVNGNTCATWQNRVWFGGDPASPSRLSYSDIGSVNRTSVNQFNDIREKDSALITCMGGASGQDIQGRPGLIVCKSASSYRVHDPNTGAYTTIDTNIGCGSNVGMISAYGRTYVASVHGIYSTDGLEAMREESQLIDNVFHPERINQSRPDLFAAGRWQDRLRFSYPKAGETFNSLAFELHPIQNWVVSHTDAASWYVSLGRGATSLVMGSPTVNGMVYNGYSGGSDNGVAITSKFQTRWMEPARGYKARIRRIRFTGRGIFNATVLQDFERTQSGITLPVAIVGDEAIYDDPGAVYDDPDTIYGPTRFQGKQDFYSIGVMRQLSIKIEETSSLTHEGREILEGGSLPEEGAWGLAFASVLAIDLGIT
jgi:hypothetical protein